MSSPDTPTEAPNEAPDKPIVHALWHGRPLCGFMGVALPGTWPKEHRWISAVEYELLTGRACPECVVAHLNWSKMVHGILETDP